MIFKIVRESIWDDGKPCEEAFHHEVPNIKRQDGMEKCWGINVDSLNDLINLSKKYGQLVFNEDKIEIYDDYRE